MKKKYKIISVVGARPNFMKVAPLHKSLKRYSGIVKHYICHTGQHYDEGMSKIFFSNLELPKPDFYLGAGSASHAVQTAKIMIEFEKVLIDIKPDLVIVAGDVNSTIACALTAVKLGIKVAHIEAGLRSFDRSMPEEINRILTDAISDYLFVTEKSGLINLRNEGISGKKIFFTGNTMIDSLVNYLPKTAQSNIFKNLRVDKKNYILVTLHRPSNVDDEKNLKMIMKMFNQMSKKIPVVFPVHPRTRRKLKNIIVNDKVILTPPLGYIDFLALMKDSSLVITDSGGIQEETTYLKIPCITLRKNTERPVTVEAGTNHLISDNGESMNSYLKKIQLLAGKILDGKSIKKGSIPEKWDGKASDRIASVIIRKIFKEN